MGAVARSDRELTIRVSIVDAAGRELKVHPTVSETRRGKAGSEADFFEQHWAKFDAKDVTACRGVIGILEGSGIRGLTKSVLPSGRPVFALENTRFGRVRVLQVPDSKPALRDAPDKSKKILNNPAAAAAWKAFQASLLKIPGAARGGKAHSRVYVPVRQVAAHPEPLLDAIRRLEHALSHYPDRAEQQSGERKA